MRNSTPLKWIEQAEANEVLAAARFEQAAPAARPVWRCQAQRVMTDGVERLRGWLTMVEPGVFLLQAQPVRVRRPSCRPVRRPGDDDDYQCRW